MSGLDSDKLKWAANGRNMKWNREAAEKIQDDFKTVTDEINSIISVPPHNAGISAANKFLKGSSTKDACEWGAITSVVNMGTLFDAEMQSDIADFLTAVATENDGLEYVRRFQSDTSFFSAVSSLIDNGRPFKIAFNFANMLISNYPNTCYYDSEDSLACVTIIIPWFSLYNINFSSSVTFFFYQSLNQTEIVLTAKVMNELVGD